MITLTGFYTKTGVWGLWKPVRRCAGEPGRVSAAGRDFGYVVLGVPFMVSLYLGAVYVIVHRWSEVSLCAATAAIAASVLFFSWYRRLPEQ